MLNEFHRKLFDTIGANSYVGLFADPTREILSIEPYTYSVVADGLTLTATLQQFEITMDSDSDFVAVFASGCATSAGSAYPIVADPDIVIQIRENWSGKTWFNVPTLMPLVAGQGGYPHIMQSPRLIPPRTTISVFAGADWTQTYTGFHFSLHGGRIYYK